MRGFRPVPCLSFLPNRYTGVRAGKENTYLPTLIPPFLCFFTLPNLPLKLVSLAFHPDRLLPITYSVIPAVIKCATSKTYWERTSHKQISNAIPGFATLEQRRLQLYWTLTCFLSATEKNPNKSPYIFLYNLKIQYSITTYLYFNKS